MVKVTIGGDSEYCMQMLDSDKKDIVSANHS